MKATLHLVRDVQSNETTFGKLYLEDDFLCFTLELPYRFNARGISCIPTGLYKCHWRNSPRFGRSIELLDVPNRKYILIHSGNKVKDTNGCILVGEERLIRDKVLLLSKRAKDLLYKRLEAYDEIEIEVIGQVEDIPVVDVLSVYRKKYLS